LYFITSTARARICPRCREPIVAGICEGLNVRVDPYPAEPIIQALAVVLGRGTYELINRTLWSHVDPNPYWPILIEHRCGRPLTRYIPGPETSTVADDVPPF
jgi:hypothetical protein